MNRHIPGPHPLNQDFAWRERLGPFRVIDAAQADDWNSLGYFVMRDVISAEDINKLVLAIDPLERRAEAYLEEKGGRIGIARANEITFTVHIVMRSSIVREFATSPLMTDLCLDLLGPDCRLYWDQAVYKKPGTAEEFPWHQDNGYNFVDPQDYLTCWIPLTPATIDNGCPWVVPGVHRQGTLRHWSTPLGYQCLTDVGNAQATPVMPGDMVVFSSLTPHRTGPNLTTGVRKAYILQYARDGAEMVSPEGTRTRQADTGRQFLVTRAGEPAA